MQVLESFLAGGQGKAQGSPAPLGAGAGSNKIEPLSMGKLPPEKKLELDNSKTESRLAKGENLLKELERENRSGFQLGESNRSSEEEFKGKLIGKKGGLEAQMEAEMHKVSSNDAIGDNYDDDFDDDDIEEDLPADANEEVQIDDGSGARNPAAVSGSGHGITVS